MKRLKLLCGGMILLLIVACEKESVEVEQANAPAHISTKSKTDKRVACDDTDWRVWDASLGDCHCLSTGSCMRDVIIDGFTPLLAKGVNEVFDAIPTANTLKIQTAIKTNYNALDDYVNDHLLQGVLNNSIRLESFENVSLSKKFMLFYDRQSNDLLRVYPFSTVKLSSTDWGGYLAAPIKNQTIEKFLHFHIRYSFNGLCLFTSRAGSNGCAGVSGLHCFRCADVGI